MNWHIFFKCHFANLEHLATGTFDIWGKFMRVTSRGLRNASRVTSGICQIFVITVYNSVAEVHLGCLITLFSILKDECSEAEITLRDEGKRRKKALRTLSGAEFDSRIMFSGKFASGAVYLWDISANLRCAINLDVRQRQVTSSSGLTNSYVKNQRRPWLSSRFEKELMMNPLYNINLAASRIIGGKIRTRLMDMTGTDFRGNRKN